MLGSTWRRFLERLQLAEVDRDLWEKQASEATATAATVVSAVDSALCALNVLHDMDENGVCSCGHVSPCPTGQAVAELWPYWASMPERLAPVLGHRPRAA